MRSTSGPGTANSQYLRYCISISLLLLFVARAFALPPGFQQETVLSGLSRPVNIQALPDGRMLLLQQSGQILIFNPGAQPAQTSAYLTLTNIESGQERGLASMALDPDFKSNGYIYLYYTHKGSKRNRISRFTHQGNTASLASEFLVWQDNEDWSSCCHYGGGLDFGPDGRLYLTTGEEFDGNQAQALNRAGGKIIRINKDGTVPSDNPFVDGPGGNLDEVWAYGLRNPYRAHWDRVKSRFYVGEVGGNVQATAWEDLHLGRAGANYGWPECEGPCTNPLYDDPIYSYDHTAATPNGGAISAGFIYQGAVPTAGLVAHFEADKGVAVSGNDVVLAWNDQSSRGNHLAASGNPTLVSNALNGNRVIDFDGAGDKLERTAGLSGLPAGSSNRTVYMVANYRGNGHGGLAWGTANCNQAFGLIVNATGKLMVQGWCNDFDSGDQGTGAGWLVQSAVLANGKLDHYQNGSLIDSRTHNYNTVVNAMVLGAELDSAPFVNMQVAAVFVFDHALNKGEQDQVQSYLQHKYFNTAGNRLTSFPPSYVDAFFFGDYALSFIKYLTFNPNGSVATVNSFATNVGAPVAFEQGLDGAMYVVDYIGRVLRFKYVAGNQPPSITSVTISPSIGTPPLNTSFSVAASDPEGDNLTYHWFFGDGASAFGQSVMHTYTARGVHDAYVVVSDGTNDVLSNIQPVEVGSPPVVTISAPVDGSFFRAGDTINFSGSAVDPDETIPAGNFSWDVNFVHNAHKHPAISNHIGKTGQILVETSGHDWHDDTGYEFALTVVDSDGIERTSSVTAYPDKVNLSFASIPSGIPVSVDGLSQNTPYVYDTLIGFEHGIAVPATYCLAGQRYRFSSWSDGGAASHPITAPASNQTYTATFSADGQCSALPSNGLVAHYEATSGVTTSGNTVTAWADQSGRGNHLSAAGDPQLVPGAANGLPAVDFDGNGDKLERTSGVSGLPAGASDRTVYLVADYHGTGYGGFAFGTNSSNRTFGLVVDPGGNLMVQGWGTANDFDSGNAGTGQGWHVQSATVASGQLSHYLDGTLIDGRSHTYNTALTRIVLGAEIDSNPFVDMRVAAVLVYDRALSSVERSEVQAYLSNKYIGGGPVNTAPIVAITAPASGSSFDVGELISFTATATDAEDGNLASSIVWNSSIDGNIGMTGSAPTSSLSAGTHTISASVTDSGLASGIDSIGVTVTGSGGIGPYQQAPDGTVSMEAEHFDANVASGGSWSPIAPAGASNGQAMLGGSGGRLEYEVNFTQAGTHYVYVRAFGPNGQANSAYVGINGNWTGQFITASPFNSWQWEGPVAINVAALGVQTIGVTVRESGTQVDKVVILKTAAVPTGNGPTESIRAGGGPSNAAPVVTITAPVSGSSFDVGELISFTATATDEEDGNLASSILWNSSIDGNIGMTGSMSTSSLSDGTHTVTASVTDSSSANGSDAISISVDNNAGVGPYQQALDGTVSMEAEHFDVNVASGGSWSPIAPAGASNGQAMLAGTGGRLEYEINFNQTGTHYIYVRAYGPDGNTNSVFAGIDGNWTSQFVHVLPLASWQWEGAIVIDVLNAGVHRVGLAKREAGTQVDKIVVLKSATVPIGAGPTESPRSP